MSVIKSLVIAFSMYSKIPMPHLELEEKDMRYVMGFFPLAGLVIGAVIGDKFLFLTGKIHFIN